jgi:hypothetical protein
MKAPTASEAMRAVEIHNPHHLRHCLPATPTTPPKPETEFRFKFLRSRNIQKSKMAVRL